MQNEIKSILPLHNELGHLTAPGWSKKENFQYDRALIKASNFRIKEWDYYLITNDAFAVALTIADNGYMSMLSASLLEYKYPRQITKSYMGFFPMGKLNLPNNASSGTSTLANKRSHLTFTVDPNKRILKGYIADFRDGFPLKIDIVLSEEPSEHMVIATPFSEDPLAFYYNQKILGMKASGKISIKGENYLFSPINSYGLLDWGRGVWTYDNTWYWAAAQSTIAGKTFGFNIGCGFGDTSAATENILLYDGKVHKLDQVSFEIPKKNGKDDYLSPWIFHSNDARFELTFTPIIDRAADTDFILLQSDQHQVFGKYKGTVVLDDGAILSIENILGFAEKVHNRW